MAYMNEWEIQQMAESALSSYEMTADWNAAYRAAVEFAMDEWEIKATQAQAATAMMVAKTGWEGIKMSVPKVNFKPQY